MKRNFHTIGILFCCLFMSCKNESEEQQKSTTITDTSAKILPSAVVNVPTIDSAALLKNEITKIIRAFKQQDAKTLNSYIDPQIGFYLIPGRGTVSYFERMDTISFKNPYFSYHQFGSPSNEVPALVVTNSSPLYSCEEWKWNKLGLFLIDDYPVFNNIIRQQKQNDIEITPHVQQLADKMDAISQSVFLTEKESDIIFGIVKHNGKYILTYLDFRPTYCDV